MTLSFSSTCPLLLLTLGASLIGCNRSTPPTLDAAVALPSDASISTDAETDSGVKRLTTDERRRLMKELRDGRALATATKWTEAIPHYENALTIDPADGRTLSELGFAALHTGDFAKAKLANEHALRCVSEPQQRAQVLYNSGRVDEATGDKESAKKHYVASLSLRANATVAARLKALGVTAATSTMDPISCVRSHASLDDLCKCLSADRDAIMIPEGTKFSCAEDATPRTEPFRVVTYGSAELGERVHLVVAKTATGWLPVADAGHDFEPGAFGVHNESAVTGLEKRDGDQFLIRVNQSNYDSNAAGLEVYESTFRNVIFCAGGPSPRCFATISESAEASLSYRSDADGLTSEDMEWVRMRKKDEYKKKTQLEWSISDAKVLSVKLKSGPSELIKVGMIGEHPLH